MDETSNKLPFLSVIIRTQGKRFETLKEVFLCLYAQIDQDFEVILILHNADEIGKSCVSRIIDMQPYDLQKRIRLFEMKIGERGAPLNFALSVISGTYFAVLDDDDIVFDDWTSVFHKASLSHNGLVIRCYGLTQEWSVSSQENGDKILLATGKLSNTYCSEFSLLYHFSENATPISCAAYPSALVKHNNLLFDESLTTNEDWDFFMRCVLSFGIYDTKCATFLYRLWRNVETSHVLHQDDEWNKNIKYVQEKLKNISSTLTGEQLIEYRNKSVNEVIIPLYKDQFQCFGLRYLLKQILKALRQKISLVIKKKQYVDLIQKSVYFDEEWYLEKNASIKTLSISAAEHYLLWGWRELLDPSSSFSTLNYILSNKDLLKANICPLLHYEMYGKSENRRIMMQ